MKCPWSLQIGLLGLLERENAAILNEALRPLAQQTIRAFRKALDDLGLKCAFYLTQNDGTLIRYTQQYLATSYTATKSIFTSTF